MKNKQTYSTHLLIAHNCENLDSLSIALVDQHGVFTPLVMSKKKQT